MTESFSGRLIERVMKRASDVSQSGSLFALPRLLEKALEPYEDIFQMIDDFEFTDEERAELVRRRAGVSS